MRRLTLSQASLILMVAVAVFSGSGSISYGSVSTQTYGFIGITNNNPSNVRTGENQFILEVLDVGTLLAQFRLRNVGPNASSITAVYFDDDAGFDGSGLLIGIAVPPFTPNPGVSFSEGADPANLPGGNLLPNPFIADFSAGADDPKISKGVNPSEEINILMSYTTGLPAEQGFFELIGAIDSGTLRIGVLADGFGYCGTESFVNFIPEPCSGVLVSLGVLVTGLIKKRGLI